MSQRLRNSQRRSTQQIEQSQFEISTQRQGGNDQYDGSTQAADILSTRSCSYANEEEDLSRKADECVQYILICSLAEKKAVVRRSDLNKNILKEYSRKMKDIIPMIKVRLSEVFGMELIELDKVDKFGIRSKYEYDFELNKPNVEENKLGEISQAFQDKFKYSMIMISLSLIFMNDNEISSDLFWQSLKRLDISKEDKKHKYLGDVWKYFVTDLVKDGYLEYEKIPGIEPPSYKFKAGYRAKLEISKKSLLKFVCEIYGGTDACSPQEWSTQYADAEREQKEMNDSEMEA